MKKLLFSLALSAGAIFSSAYAQSKTWDFNDKTAFPTTTAGVTASTTINGLTFVPGDGVTNFAIFDGQSADFTVNYTSETYKPTQRVNSNGASYTSGNDPIAAPGKPFLPTQRYISFPVTGAATVKVWSRGGGTGRSVLVTDGVSNLGSVTHTGSNSSADAKIFTATYAGSAGTLYVANGTGSNSIFKIELIETATMAVNDGKSGLKAKVFSSGNKIYLSNLESKNTDVKVYSANGSLVKSFKTSAETNFEINAKGLYIVNMKSEAGEKSVKVLLK